MRTNQEDKGQENIPSFSQDTVSDSVNVSFARSDMGPSSSFGMGDIPQLRQGRAPSTAQKKGMTKDPEREDNHGDIDVNHE